MIESVIFTRLILLSILINIVFLSVEHYKQSSQVTNILDTANYVFIAIFTIEMLLKLFVYSIKGYFSDWFNTFDCIMVVTSYFELIFTQINANLTAFRAFRLLRVARVIQNVPSLRRLVTTILGSISGVLYMTALMGIFIFMFAVLGMQLFGDIPEDTILHDNNETYNSNDIVGLTTARFGFQNILWSSVTVFQIITLDNWNNIVSQIANVEDKTITAIFYFLAVVSFGYFILFNLYIAVLLQQFTEVKVSEIGIHAASDADRLALQSLGETTNKLLKQTKIDESNVKHILKKTIRETKQRRRKNAN